MSEKYFYNQFTNCPYCNCEYNDIKELRFWGAHRCAYLECIDCKETWISIDVKKID